MQLFKVLAELIMEIWNTYPCIKGDSMLCAYYRKMNRNIPPSYLLIFLGIIVAEVSRTILIFMEQDDPKPFLIKMGPIFLTMNVLHSSAIYYAYKLKSQAEAKENKENLAYQQQIKEKMQICPATHFICTIFLILPVLFGSDCNEPVDLSWLASFIIQLYGCMWLVDSVRYKAYMMSIHNTVFCLFAAQHASYREDIICRIIVPVLFAVVLLVAHDRSVRKNFLLKRAIRQHKIMYMKFLQGLQDPVLIINKEELLFHNKSASHSLGDTASSFYEAARGIVSIKRKETLEDAVKKHLTSNCEEESVEQDRYLASCVIDHESEQTWSVTLIVSRFFSSAKTISLALRDITAELSQEKKRLEEKYKNMMLFSLSHELRTPLGILQSAVKLSKYAARTDQQKECYKSGKGAWHYLRNKINDTLVYAQLQTGEFALHEELFSLTEFIEGLRKITSFLLQKKADAIKLVFECILDVEDKYMGDRERFEQILFNLLQNAVKYTDQGTISLKVYQKLTGIVFEVADTGHGMPEDVVKDMFHPTHGKDMDSICGLGLTVSNMICKAMYTKLEVTSVIGKGSTFHFVMPPTSPRDETTACVARENCDVNITTWGSYNKSRKNIGRLRAFSSAMKIPNDSKVSILIVDDNDFNRVVVKQMISKFKIFVEEASDGEEALIKLEKLQKICPDNIIVIFMDLDMPILNGIDSTIKIRKLNCKPTPYICALTAFSSEHERERCFSAGMDAFVSKPLTKRNLMKVFRDFKIDINSYLC